MWITLCQVTYVNCESTLSFSWHACKWRYGASWFYLESNVMLLIVFHGCLSLSKTNHLSEFLPPLIGSLSGFSKCAVWPSAGPKVPIINDVIKRTQSRNAPNFFFLLFFWLRGMADGWWDPAEVPLIKTEVAEQSSTTALSRRLSFSPGPLLQSQAHNVQSLNSSRPWLRASRPLYTLPQCKHLIKIAWAATIATKCNSRSVRPLKSSSGKLCILVSRKMARSDCLTLLWLVL